MEVYDVFRPVPLPPADNRNKPADVPSVWLMSAEELERYLMDNSKRD